MRLQAHFTLFALQLDLADPTHYLYDGVSRPLEKKTVSVEVKGATGVTTQGVFVASRPAGGSLWPTGMDQRLGLRAQ
ncbi:MAG: penicillin acylase family protein [Burkholderiaceae bacterium]